MKTKACLLSLLISLQVFADPITEGNKCWDEKNYQCVVDNYRQALSSRQYKEQDYPIIQYRIGHSLGKLGRHSEGITALREAMRTKPGYPSAIWETAWLFYSSSKYDSATAYYTKAIPFYTDPANLFKLNYWKGQSMVGEKKYKESIPFFKAAYLIDSNDVYAAAGIADAALNSYDYNLALQYYKRALAVVKKEDVKLITSLTYWKGKANFYLAKYTDAMADYKKVLSYDPQYRLAIWDIGGVYYDQKKWADAETYYSKAIQLYSDDKESRRSLYYYRAITRFKQNNLTGAMSDYDMVLQIDPSYVSAVWGKAEILEKQNKTKDVIALYTKAIDNESLNNSRQLFYYKRGEVALKQKDTTSAYKDFKKAIEEDMYLGEPNMALGHIEFARKKYTDAITYYEAALDDFTYFPDSTEMGTAYLRKGISNWKIGYVQTAEQDFLTASGYLPKDGGPRRFLGELYYSQKKYAKAAVEFSSAITDYKNTPDSLHKMYYYRGLTNIELKKYKEALADFGEAVRLKPGEVEYIFRLGQLQFEVKEYNKAKETFTKIIGLLKPANKQDLAISYYCRGRCWFELNDKIKAKADFTKALEYVPDYKECKDWLAKTQ
ncbi:tetratricopeptide repeat protein [Nostoc ellipsosporum NOK]|nr:tetratricopeptide repeat protein [Nostoc ellipsosporum NOK]